jgi:hypothetical protein
MQLPKLFGVTGGGDDFFERMGHLVRQVPETNLPTLAIGLGDRRRGSRRRRAARLAEAVARHVLSRVRDRRRSWLASRVEVIKFLRRGGMLLTTACVRR